MKDHNETFASRLQSRLAELGIAEPARARYLATAGGVSISTARRYLRGQSEPHQADRAWRLARGLGLDPGWLIDGTGLRTVQDRERFDRLAWFYAELPEADRRRFDRFADRIAGGDEIMAAAAKRYFSGRLTFGQLMAAAARVN